MPIPFTRPARPHADPRLFTFVTVYLVNSCHARMQVHRCVLYCIKDVVQCTLETLQLGTAKIEL